MDFGAPEIGERELGAEHRLSGNPKKSCYRRLHRSLRELLAGRVSIQVNRQNLRILHLNAMVRAESSTWYRFLGSYVY